MRARFSTGTVSGERHRRTTIPTGLAFLDYLSLMILLAVAAGVIWVLGGNRDWVMMPAVFLVFTAGIIFVFRFLVTRYRTDIAIPPGGWIALVFLVYPVLLLPFSKIPYETILQIFRFASYVLAYWMWFNLLRVNGRWRWALSIVLVSVSMMACYSIIQDVQGTRSVVFAERHPNYGMRASGAYICPNHFAHLLVMIILASLGLLLSRKPGTALKLFAGYAVITCLYPLFLSESRSGWIGLAIGLVVMAVTAFSGRGLKKLLVVMLIAPLIAIATGWIVWKISPRVQMRVADAMTGNMRIPLWQDSIDVALLSPWLGNGLGTYRHIYPHFRKNLQMTNDPEFAHNEFVHFWGELGLLGLGIAGLLVLLVFYRAWQRAYEQSSGAESASIPAAITAIIAGSWTHAFFDFNFNIFGNVHAYIFLLAALMAAAGRGRHDHTLNVAGPRARLAGIAIVVLIVVAGGMYGRLAGSYFQYIRGLSQLDLHEWEGAADRFKRATRISEGNWRAHLAYADVMRTRAFWMRNPEIRDQWVKESMQSYETAGRLNSWEGNVWYGMGMLYAMHGDQETALALKRKAADEIPKNTFYLNALGLQLVKMRRDQEALDAFTKSMAAEPTPVAERNIALLTRRLATP